MKRPRLLGIALAALTIAVGAEGCSASSDAAPTGIRCTPGAFIFCRCADRAEGTKLCKADGASFEACTTSTNGACVGGEDLTGPGVGEPAPAPTTSQPPGPPGSTVDACPGKPTAVTPGAAIVIAGDTTTAGSDLKGAPGPCAAGDKGPDHVYRLQPTATGKLSVSVKGEGALDALLYLRAACADETSQSACAPPLGPARLVQLQANVVAGRDYFLVVDGAAGSAGKYQLSLELATSAFCGDGTVDPGEACDDGNQTDGDGCSSTCRAVDGDPASADCTVPHPVHLWKGASVTGTGGNAAYGNAFTTPGTACDPTLGTNPGPDHVYEVTAHAAGTLKVTIAPNEAGFNPQLIARRTCALGTTQAAAMCANDASAGAAEVMTFTVQSNEKVYVSASGALLSKGTYTLKFELP